MNPYDERKVEKANLIYEQLMKTSSSDLEFLKELRKQAIQELGISFIAEEYIERLKVQCNPQRFMEPYNAEKVQIANTLYNKLLKNESDVEILEAIETEINEHLNS